MRLMTWHVTAVPVLTYYAFCRVKLGVHEETGEQVAVKIMDKSDIRAQEMTMNVRREVRLPLRRSVPSVFTVLTYA